MQEEIERLKKHIAPKEKQNAEPNLDKAVEANFANIKEAYEKLKKWSEELEHLYKFSDLGHSQIFGIFETYFKCLLGSVKKTTICEEILDTLREITQKHDELNHLVKEKCLILHLINSFHWLLNIAHNNRFISIQRIKNALEKSTVNIGNFFDEHGKNFVNITISDILKLCTTNTLPSNLVCNMLEVMCFRIKQNKEKFSQIEMEFSRKLMDLFSEMNCLIKFFQSSIQSQETMESTKPFIEIDMKTVKYFSELLQDAMKTTENTCKTLTTLLIKAENILTNLQKQLVAKQ
ncbi:hypothetical protein FACS1894113_4220 [Alphaproteobacteria bacterium]|nr:hypothetical protein FACS1894113_4220 [Alphaproteobacteria bacterium]